MNLYAFVQGGLGHENKTKNGLYNLLGHLLAKGYKGMSYHNLKLKLDKMSSTLNGFSGKSSYGLGLHGLSQHSSELCQIFFNSLMSPSILNTHFNHEKKMAKRGLLNQQEDPVKQCFLLAHKAIFEGHPYALPSLGTVESLNNIGPDHVREAHAKNLKSKEIVLTFSGDMEWGHLLEEITPYVNQLRARKRTVKKAKKKMATITDKNAYHHKEISREQTHLFMGMRTFPRGHRNDLFMRMLTTHLSGQSSELFVKMRDEQGLCYVVQPIYFAAKEGGSWGIYMASSADKTNQAMDALREVFGQYRQKGLNPQEFSRLKQVILGQELINIQTNDDYAQVYSVPVLEGLGLDYHHESMKFMENASRGEFNKVIQSVFSNKRVEIVVGPPLS